MPDGPLLVYGNLNVKSADGSEARRSNETAFCRCGASGNKPYCDGSHAIVNTWHAAVIVRRRLLAYS